MKQICSIVLAAAVLIAAALPGIAADELIYSAQYLGATQSLEISGTAGAAAGKMVILTICARETVPDAQAVTEGLAVAKALHTGEAGAFSAVIGLPDSFASGFYTLYFSGDFSAAPYQFSHMNQGQAERAVAEINRAEELATFTDTVGEQIGAFGLDAAAHQEYGAYVCEVLYAVKPAAGYTAEGFFDGYASAVASYFIKYSSQALDQVLAIYSGNIGIDYQKDYNRFSNEIKQNLYMQLKKEDFTKRPFLPIYQEALVLAQVKAAGQYPILAEVILEHAGALGLSLTAYHGLNQSQQAQVFRLMMGDARLNAFSTIKPLFEECVQKAGQQKEPSSGGNGGGGSISGSGQVPSPAPTETQKPDQPGPAETFPDMEGHWGREAVEKLAQSGVISGFEDGTFRPEEKVTRAQFLKLAVCALEIKKSGQSPEFSDVPADSWYAPYVEIAGGSGLIQGEDGRFRPEDPVTREEAAVILYRCMAYVGQEPFGLHVFDDEAEISNYALDQVSALGGAGILQGDGGRFYPKNPTTRAEAAALILNMLQYIS